MAVFLPAAQYQRSPAPRLRELRSTNRLRGGAVLGYQFGMPYWEIELTTMPLDRFQAGEWDAFFDQHGAAKSAVWMGHPEYCAPMLHPDLLNLDRAGGATFDGTGPLYAIDDAFHLTVYDLPSFMTLKKGDLVSVEEGERTNLHRVQAESVSDAGGMLNLQIYPGLKPNRTVASVMRFWQPKGEFVLLGDAVQKIEVGPRHMYQFRAVERAN